jgi:hypothetical protein
VTGDPTSAPDTVGGEASDTRLLRLASLLQIEADLRAAANRDEIQFIAANETHRLLAYEQAVVWQQGRGGRPQVSAISGVPLPDPRSPFVVWANSLVRAQLTKNKDAAPGTLDPKSLPTQIAREWNDWSPGHVVWVPFQARGGPVGAGMLLFRAEPFDDADMNLIGRLAEAYGFAWWALDPRSTGRNRKPSGGLGWRQAKLVLVILAIAVMFLPVRQSVLAPAEISPRNPLVVTAPIDGVIEAMHVAPNAKVVEGARLFSLDRTGLRNRATLAEKSVAVAQADFQRARQKAFSDPRSKGDVAVLGAEVAQKQAELSYTRELLARAEIVAGRSGIAIYADPSDWIGKPVRLGEKVLAIADPAALELTIWVPVGDAIGMMPGAEILFFLDTDPLNPIRARLVRAAYEAEITPNDVLAYRAKAELAEGEPLPRIGLKGTAKVYGEEVSLFFYLMRRPIAALRRTIGY